LEGRQQEAGNRDPSIEEVGGWGARSSKNFKAKKGLPIIPLRGGKSAAEKYPLKKSCKAPQEQGPEEEAQAADWLAAAFIQERVVSRSISKHCE